MHPLLGNNESKWGIPVRITTDDLRFVGKVFCSDFFLWYWCCRRRPLDASGPEYDAAITNIFQILLSVSKDILLRCSSISPPSIDEREFEFAECICESLVSLGSTNLQSIAGDISILSLYLQQVIIVAWA